MKDILESLFYDKSVPLEPDDARIWKIWPEVVGSAIARNARPLWIRKGQLRVAVSGPIWLQELRFMEEDIRNRLNHALGREAVERIEFRLGTK